MDLDHAKAAAIAQDYFGTTDALKRLGWGIGGYVYLSPDARAAVKVHRSEEFYVNELRAYRLLRKLRVTRLHGLNVPTLWDSRDESRLICMDFVSAPFLLDFAGVLFHPPDFSDDVMQDWHAGIARMYGPNAHVAYAVYNLLQAYGMYYMDFRPSNLKLDGLPGLEPMPADDDDEKW